MNKDATTQIPPFRIGHGYDVHRFGEGDFIVLGGVEIPHHSVLKNRSLRSKQLTGGYIVLQC